MFSLNTLLNLQISRVSKARPYWQLHPAGPVVLQRTKSVPPRAGRCKGHGTSRYQRLKPLRPSPTRLAGSENSCSAGHTLPASSAENGPETLLPPMATLAHILNILAAICCSIPDSGGSGNRSQVCGATTLGALPPVRDYRMIQMHPARGHKLERCPRAGRCQSRCAAQ